MEPEKEGAQAGIEIICVRCSRRLLGTWNLRSVSCSFEKGEQKERDWAWAWFGPAPSAREAKCQ